MCRVAAAALAVFLGVPAVSADESAGIQAGTRVRVHYREAAGAGVRAVTGNLESASEAEVTLAGTGTAALRIPVEKIVRIEVSRGRHRHGRTGLLAGAGFGLAGAGVCLAAGCGGNGATVARSTAVWASVDWWAC